MIDERRDMRDLQEHSWIRDLHGVLFFQNTSGLKRA